MQKNQAVKHCEEERIWAMANRDMKPVSQLRHTFKFSLLRYCELVSMVMSCTACSACFVKWSCRLRAGFPVPQNLQSEHST